MFHACRWWWQVPSKRPSNFCESTVCVLTRKCYEYLLREDLKCGTVRHVSRKKILGVASSCEKSVWHSSWPKRSDYAFVPPDFTWGSKLPHQRNKLPLRFFLAIACEHLMIWDCILRLFLRTQAFITAYNRARNWVYCVPDESIPHTKNIYLTTSVLQPSH